VLELRERNLSGSAADHAAFVRAWAELELDQTAPPRDVFACHQAPHAFFLETATGEVAAYALIRGYGARGDVRQIVVMPAWRGRGVGKRLMAAVAARLRRAGCSDWRLEVKAENAAAIGLYESVGMKVRRPMTIVRLDARAAAATVAAAGPGAARLRPLRADVEAPYEDAFDLGRGFLAAVRARRPDLPMLALEMAGMPAGLVRWIPDYLGACGLLFPFRARDTKVLPALLAAADGAAGQIELMGTDAGVSQWLLGAGARTHECLLEMGAPLPRATVGA